MKNSHFPPILFALLLTGCPAEGTTGTGGDPHPACTEAGPICVGELALVCNANGTARSQDNCLEQGLRCDGELGCVQCVSFGASSCMGESFVDCSADGEITSRRDCFAEGLVCAGAGLGCATCVPGRRSCDGDTVQVCNATGTAWDAVEVCGGGLHCDVNDGTCADLCTKSADNNSYIGCDYWATTTANSPIVGSLDEFSYALVVSNAQAIEALVTVRHGGDLLHAQAIPPGAVEVIELPWRWSVYPKLEVAEGDWEFASFVSAGDGFHVQSDVPVTVYQFSPLEYRVAQDCAGDSSDTPDDGECFSFSNDASLLLPTHVLTGDYMVVTQPSSRTRRTWWDGDGDQLFLVDGEERIRETFTSSPGFATIIATEATRVEVTTTAHVMTSGTLNTTVAGMAPGETQAFDLSAGDVLQLVSAMPPRESCAGREMDVEIDCPSGATAPCVRRYTYCDAGTAYDLTGTRIRSTGAVQVFAGHDCANIPHYRSACDHLEESMFPLQSWGREVIVSVTEPVRGEPNIVRIVSSSSANTLTFSPAVHETVTLGEGDFIEFETSQDFRVTGTQPISVGQFLVGQNYAGPGAAGEGAIGDPSFSLAIPIEQYRTSYSFLAPETFEQSWINVTAEAGHAVLLDGSPVTDWRAIEGTGYVTARVPVSGGAHEISSDAPVGVVVYGFGSFTSYMYPAGLDLEVINLI